MFSESFYNHLRNVPEHLVSDRKFDIAMRSQDVLYTVERMKRVQATPLSDKEFQLRVLAENTDDRTIIEASTESNLWTSMLRDILLGNIGQLRGKRKENDNTGHILECCRMNLVIQYEYNARSDRTMGATNKRGDFINWVNRVTDKNNELSRFVHIEKMLFAMIERQGRLKHLMKNPNNRKDVTKLAEKCKWDIPELDFSVCWNDRVCVATYKSRPWILPSTYLLLMHNKLCDVISTMILLRCLEGNSLENDAWEKARTFLLEMSSISVMQPSVYFTVAKTLEGAIIAEIINKEEEYKNDDLLKNIVDELEDEGYYYMGSSLRDLLRSCTVPLMHELGGLIKVLGHPIINMDDTVKSFLAKVNKETSVCMHAMQRAANCAKESFIRSYILKRRQWPPCTIDKYAPASIVEAHKRNLDPKSFEITSKYGEVDTQSYVYVTLEKLKELDRVHHYAQHLKDKTISLVQSKIARKYISGTYQKYDWRETRLLLMYLLRDNDHDELQDYLKNYIGRKEGPSGFTSEDIMNYLCVKLVPKEKELKIKGRLFGCKTYEDRFRCKVQEENAANLMDEYMIDQSMTLDNLGLIRRLYAFRMKKKAYKGWKALWVNFDVSSWAEHWRKENTAPIMSQTLDRIYDTNLFSKTHDAYERGFFYIPTNDGKDYYWEGQLGGVQGLNQYTWMNNYVPIMKDILMQFGLHFYVMAYGDDYKGCFLIPPGPDGNVPLDLAKFKRDITKSVEDVARTQFGHEMKSYDSYGSECYVSFCKKASVRGIELPQSLRKALKCHGSTNAFLPTIDDYIAGAYSNAHGAAKETCSTYGPYMLALFWSFYHLSSHIDYTMSPIVAMKKPQERTREDLREPYLSRHQLVALSLTPSLMGGLPIIYLHNFHTRSESDYLSPFLDIIKFGLDSLEITDEYKVAVEMSKFLNVEFITVDKPMEALLRDPYSLPIAKPPLATSVLRNSFKDKIRGFVRNEEVLELFEASESDWTERFVKCLVSSEVLHPRLLAAIYACTPKAVLEEFLRRFENASSIKQILVMRSGHVGTRRILRNVIKADRALQQWRAGVLAVNEPNINFFRVENWCPSEKADLLRSKWGKPIKGVSMAPSQHQIFVIEHMRGSADDWNIQNHFSYKVSEESVSLRSGNTSDHWKLGTEDPFLGHRTRLNLELPTVRITENNPQLLKLQNLLDLVTWTNKYVRNPDGTITASNLPDLIGLLVKQFYKGDIKELSPFAGNRKGGTIAHHVRSPHYKEFIMPNTLYNSSTFWRSETNCHQTLKDNVSDHLSMNFLQLKCFAEHTLDSFLEFGPRRNRYGQYWGVTTPCAHCAVPIVDEPIVVNMSLAPPSCRVLAFTKLDKHSETVIKDCLLVFQEKEILNLVKPGEDAMAIEIACMAAIDSSVNDEYQAMAAMRTHFRGGVTASEESHKLMSMYVGSDPKSTTIIRYTELKKIPTDIIVESLCSVVFQFLRSRYKNTSREGLAADIRDRPGDELPWKNVLVHLGRAHRMGSVIRRIQEMTGFVSPAGVANYVSLAKWVGIAALEIIDTGKIRKRLAIVTNYDDDTIVRKLIRFEYTVRSHYLATNVGAHMKQLIKNKFIGVEDTGYLTAFVIFFAMMPPPDFEKIKEAIKDCMVNDDYFYRWNALERDDDVEIFDSSGTMFGIYLEEPEELPYFSLLDFYRKRYPDMQWDMTWEEFQFHYQNEIFPSLFPEEERDTFICDIGMCALSNASLRVRAMPDQLERHDEFTPFARVRRLEGIPYPRIIVRDRNLCCIFNNENLGELGGDLIDRQAVYATDQAVFSKEGSYRVYGQGSTAMNDFSEIMNTCHMLRLPRPDEDGLPENLRVSCLAEGAGGVLGFLAKITRNSSFLFNTLPQTPEEERASSYPLLAKAAVEMNGHRLSSDLVDADVNDLMFSSTLEAMERKMTGLDMVTCDLEPGRVMNGVDYSTILHNVCIYYLRNRRAAIHGTDDKGGILIFKVYVDKGIGIYYVVSLLLRYSRHVYLLRASGSDMGSEMYLVAYGIRAEFTETYHYREVNIVSAVIRKINGLKRALRNEFGAAKTNYTMSLEFPQERLNHLARMMPLTNLFQPAILQQLSGRLFMDISAVEFMEVKRGRQERVAYLHDNVRAAVVVTLDSLVKNCRHGPRGSLNTDTLSAQVSTAQKLIALQGMEYVLSVVLLPNARNFSTAYMRQHFRKCLNEHPDRVYGVVGRNFKDPNHPVYRLNAEVAGLNYDFYYLFTRSVSWGLAYATWENLLERGVQ